MIKFSKQHGRIRTAVSVGIIAALMITMLMGCKLGGIETEVDMPAVSGVTINITTTYAGSDGNSKIFKEAVKAWENETGNKVIDNSVTSDEAFKSRVLMDFRTGAEPDVLFYFTGVDANPLVANRRVVSISEIREVYPEYASNMKSELMQPSPYDGQIYSIPVNGYWEGLFINKAVCEAAGVNIPDENTTWDEFMEICRAIRAKGYTPIAASLASVPHYWFEFCIYNFQNVETHAVLPESVDDEQGRAWVNGIETIKSMYEQGFFPDNTLLASDDETTRMFINGQAAFLLDGSWRLPNIEDSARDIDDFTVTFVPGRDERRSTDIISGLSSGYYISRKAWEDPEKRAAAVSFIEYMTQDSLVSQFAEVSATALVKGVQIDEGSLSSLAKAAIVMTDHMTGSCEAVQDYVPVDCRVPVFDGMPAIVRGEKDIDKAVAEVIELLRNKD